MWEGMSRVTISPQAVHKSEDDDLGDKDYEYCQMCLTWTRQEGKQAQGPSHCKWFCLIWREKKIGDGDDDDEVSKYYDKGYFGFLQTESSVARYQEFLSPKLKSFRLAKVHILIQISDKIIQNQHVKENMLVENMDMVARNGYLV